MQKHRGVHYETKCAGSDGARIAGAADGVDVWRRDGSRSIRQGIGNGAGYGAGRARQAGGPGERDDSDLRWTEAACYAHRFQRALRIRAVRCRAIRSARVFERAIFGLEQAHRHSSEENHGSDAAPAAGKHGEGNRHQQSVRSGRRGALLTSRRKVRLCIHNSAQLLHSCRSATIGSTFVARRAGTYPARAPTRSNNAATASRVTGSCGEIPNSKLAIKRAANQANAVPRKIPASINLKVSPRTIL